MGETKCYAMVRGSAVRVTALSKRGGTTDPIRFATSRSVAKVTINENTESGSTLMLGSDENDNDNRVRLVQNDEMVNYTVDVDFLKVDPGVLSLVTGVPVVLKNLGPGFGKGGFGEMVFGGDADAEGFGGDGFGPDPFGEDGGDGVAEDDLLTTGFDSVSRLAPVSFGLEVWSKLAGQRCADGSQQYGYTLFPHLRGGRLTGFEFSNGLVSFNIRGAQTRRASRWGVGPYDLEGDYQRLFESVSRNSLYRQMLTSAAPPVEVCGVQEFEDIIYGGTSSLTTDDVIDGGTSGDTTPWIIYGGQAV